MITAAFKALGDLLSRDFRSVLFKAIGLTLALFVAILIGVEVLLSYLMVLSWPWAETLAAIGAGLVLLVAFFSMISPGGWKRGTTRVTSQARRFPVFARCRRHCSLPCLFSL
jgi:uncharacterized membrane protein YphA (DoxX/SURF4 family)